MCQTRAEPAADGKMRARAQHSAQVSVYQKAVFPSRRGRLYYNIILYAASVYYYLVVVLMYTNADNDRVVMAYMTCYNIIIYIFYNHAEDSTLIYKSDL